MYEDVGDSVSQRGRRETSEDEEESDEPPMDDYGWYEESCLSPDSEATVYEGGAQGGAPPVYDAAGAAERRYLPPGMKLEDYPYKWHRARTAPGEPQR